MDNTIVQLEDRNFHIGKKNKLMALKVAKSMIGHTETVFNNSGAHWKWVNSDLIKAAKKFEDVLIAWRWKPTLDAKGNIIDLTFISYKGPLGDDELFFHSIAPFVENGSYLKIAINQRVLTWKFQGGRLLKDVS